MPDDAAGKDALVHSSAVYLYLYDAKQGQYTQQTDSVVGCALLASPRGETFSLLFYNSQTKQPVVQTPLTPAMRFTPQQNNYINFYDSKQQNFSMRFKDADASTAFLRAIVLAKAQAFVQDPGNYQDTSRAFVTLADDLEAGRESSSGGVMTGDVVGLAWTTWQGSLSTNANFFTPNPTDITQRTPTEKVAADGDLKRVVLGDADGDTLTHALSEALVGMNKHARRVVAAVYPTSQQWFIGEIELVKVKKGKGGQAPQQPATAPTLSVNADVGEDTSHHDDLVNRMAALSRAGSQTSGLMASLGARSSLKSPDTALRRQSSFNNEERRRTSGSASHTAMEDAIANPGMVPVPLPGFVTTPSSSRRSSRNQTESAASISAQTPSSPVQRVSSPPQQQQPESLAARVLSAPFQMEEPVPVVIPRPSPLESAAFTSPEMENLMKEQSELDDLRRKLEESKRRLEQQHTEPTPAPAFSTTLAVAQTPYTPMNQSTPPPPSSLMNGLTQWQPPASPGNLSLPTFNSSFPSSFNPSIGSSSLPSFTSTSLIPSPLPPPLPVSFGSRPGSSTSAASPEMENNIIRLQRSSTTIESTLHDLHSKMDRLLNLQNAMKPSKYAGMSVNANGYMVSSSSATGASGTSSSSTLLKNLEKALTQRDQLQDLNARLQDAKDQMESTIEEQQSQLESLQLENRTLFEKSHSGNHLQQEKFRMELRSVQQQLSQTQEQMLAYQEENFRLRQELSAKDDQVVKERAQVQDDARKQLEHLQRQLQVQVQEESKETLTRLQADKLRADKQLSDLSAQKTQVELERDALASQLRSLQSQLADEKAHSQAQHETRAKDLQAQLQHAASELLSVKQLLDKSRSENRQLQDVVASKEQQMLTLQEAKNKQEYAALSELLKEFMNDIYFHFQDAFEEDAEYTGKEIVMAIRKILKQNTMEILSKLEEFWHQQHQGA